MRLIGMLHFRQHPADVKKAYPFAAVAKMEGVSFFYFSFNSVDFENGKINGWIYENGEWIQKQMDFPTVIINSCNPKNKSQSAILKKLKKLAIFTSYPVGNKMKVYQKVFKAKKFADNLISSTNLNTPKDLFTFLDHQPKAVIKPLSGNQGKKVFFIEKADEQYKWIDGSETEIYGHGELETLIEKVTLEKKYMLQPFIECKTKSGLTYDFRLHVQKNGIGEWEITLIYPRISGNSKMVSNISSGGYRGELVPFLKEEFGEESINMKDILEQFSLSFASYFDTLYKHSFDELGIDVGVDQHQRLWLFEVNWRPGSKNREFEVAKRLIPYCKFLANRGMEI